MPVPIIDLDWDEPRFALRGRQQEFLDTLDAELPLHGRCLFVAPGGIGKSTIFAALAARFHERGQKTLILINRESLTHQSAGRISKETGIEADIEMAAEHASPYAPIVVASVQTLGRLNRLTSFPDSHFGLLVSDEAHFSMAEGWMRIMRYFHFGAASLDENWIEPEPGTYNPKALVAGFTATPDIGERRSLGQFYQHLSVNYSYLEAVQDGWLVGPTQASIPVRVDLRKYKARSTPTGMDYATADLAEAMEPIIEELAEQCVKLASSRKAMHFLPSVECARMMSEALNRRGLPSVFVSGECVDGDEKTDWFRAQGKGTSLCNAQIYGFGIDFPDVDCIGWFRATLSRAFYIQGVYRASRVLPGVIDGLDTAEARLEAIAASPKPDYLIIDPLFVHDRIELCDAYDLFTDKPEVKAKMKEVGELSAEAAKRGERDFLKALEKEARKHARKAARVINPLEWALLLGDEKLASYKPEKAWEMAPPTEQQLGFLRRQQFDVSKVTSKGMANKVITILLARRQAKLATAFQLNFLKRLGMSDGDASRMSEEQASETIDRMKREKGW